MELLVSAIRRESLIAWRSSGQGAALVAFFAMAVSLFPLGIGPDSALLKRIAPGAIWVAVLFSILLGLPRLFEFDHLDGTLEQMLLSPLPLPLLAGTKILAHWVVTGLPVSLLAPVLALQFDVDAGGIAILLLSLLPGTLLMCLVGAIGAALALGLRNNGMLITVLVLPLYVPILIFGAGALESHLAGLSPEGHLYLLAALLSVALMVVPWAVAAALRISLE